MNQYVRKPYWSSRACVVWNIVYLCLWKVNHDNRERSNLLLSPQAVTVCVSVCLHKINRLGCCEFVYGRQYRRCGMLFSVWIWCWLLIATVVLCSRGSRPSSSMCLKSIWSLVLREQRAHWKPQSLHRMVKYKSFKMWLFLIFLHLDHLQHHHLFLYLYIFFFCSLEQADLLSSFFPCGNRIDPNGSLTPPHVASSSCCSTRHHGWVL